MGGRARRGRLAVGLAAGAAAAGVIAGMATGCGGGPAAEVRDGAEGGAPTTAPATTATAARPVAHAPRDEALFALVIRHTWIRSRPGTGGRVLARVGRRTEFGSPRVLGVLTSRDGWLRVAAPELGNRRSGWIPERAAMLGTTRYRIHVDLSARRVEVRRGGRLLRTAGVAVGRPEHPTPRGRTFVTDKLATSGGGSPYGCCVVALALRQASLPQGWGGGDRIAIHGTTDPGSIGSASSLGCLRAPERLLRWMMRRIPLGTPVDVRA